MRRRWRPIRRAPGHADVRRQRHAAQEWEAVPLRAFPQGHVYMGGFYRSGVIAPQREDPVFERYRRLLVERHGEEKAAAVLAVDRFNNLVWPNLSVNASPRCASCTARRRPDGGRGAVFRSTARRRRCTTSRCSS